MLIDLAEHRNDGFIALKDVAERQGVSKKYLEQIVPALSRADLLRANRGTRGGYMLAKNPAKCTVAEILQLTEGDFAPVSCVGSNPVVCPRGGDCPTLPVWQGLYDVINNYLSGITLQDIIDQKNANGGYNYSI